MNKIISIILAFILSILFLVLVLNKNEIVINGN